MSLKPPDGPLRAVDPLRILTEASEVVAGHPLDLDDLLRALAELVRKVVDYQLFAVLLSDSDGALSIRHSIGYRPELVRSLRVGPGEGVTGRAARNRSTVLVDDVRNDPSYLAAVDAVRSEIAVPLVARGKVVGVIDLQSSRPGAFGETERNVLELIASRFSIAIDAALLHAETVRQNATLRTLSDIAQEFSHILNLEELLQQISSLVRLLVEYDAFSIYLLEHGMLKHYFGVRFDERVQWRSMPITEGVVGAAASSREAVLVRDTEVEERYVAAVEGIRSEVAVPLMLKDQVIGVVDLESDRVGWFNEDHKRMLSLLAPQIAAAIENARLYEEVAANERRLQEELHAARELQSHLLPDGRPSFDGIEIAAANVPATEVSGDLYDFHAFPGECFGALCGDVSGKGAAAALYAALTSGLIRNLAHQHHRPAELLEAINTALINRRIEARYLVAIYAHWRPAEREMVIANAGHPRPVLRRGGTVETIDIGGTPLGLFDGGDYDEVCFRMEPGDLLAVASDGVHEAENDEGEAYGEERFARLIGSLGDQPIERLLQAVFDDVERFSGLETPTDDRTVLIIRAV